MAYLLSSLVSLLLGLLLSGPSQNAAPTVKLDNATVIGQASGTVNKFLGIPFAQPPVGDLRLRLPKPLEAYTGTINATTFGNQCFQQTFPDLNLPSIVPKAAGQYLDALMIVPDVPQSEDCLNLNVIVPANVTPESKLPVVVWIFGGGFQVGSNALLPGEVVVARSIEVGHPVVYVTMNYRLSAFGFLGGKEVVEAGVGNLGMHDQRLALHWVQKHISAFGGDPSKVMIWGESAGSMSVTMHLLHNGGNHEGLFRAAFMESGSYLPGGYANNSYLQETYDLVVAEAGCSDSADSLQCLRTVPTSVLKAAMDKTPTLFSLKQVNLPWIPRADGVWLKEPAQQQLASGAVAKIPIVNGNDLDEGSALSFPTLNITTDEEFLDYLKFAWFQGTPRDAVAKILELYSADPADGCPFGTGDKYAYSPQYKRMSAVQGDWALNAPRRRFVQLLSKTQPVYSFVSDINRVDGLGAAHGTELMDIYGGGVMGDYLIRFASTLDPNGDGAFYWPQYTNDSPQLLEFSDGPSFTVTMDTFREEGMAYLTELSLADPV